MRTDPGFNRAALLAGGIGIGGIASPANPMDAEDQNIWSGQWERILSRHYPDVRVVTRAEMFGHDASNVGDAVRQFGGGVLTPAAVKALDASPAMPRYLAFARLGGGRTLRWSDTNRTPERKPVSTIDLLLGTDSVDEPVTTTTTYQTVVIEMEVYDIKSGTAVWSGAFNLGRYSSQARIGVSGPVPTPSRPAPVSEFLPDLFIAFAERLAP